MKNKILQLSIFLFLMIFTACNIPNKEHLQKISVLQKQAQKVLELALDKSDSSFSDKYEQIKQFDKQYITKMNWEDSLQRTIMIQFSDLKHNFKKYPEAKEKAERLAHLSISQLENLKSDEENALLKDEEFKKYYQQEKEALEELGNTISNLQFQQKLIRERYQKLIPIMKAIRDTANLSK